MHNQVQLTKVNKTVFMVCTITASFPDDIKLNQGRDPVSAR